MPVKRRPRDEDEEELETRSSRRSSRDEDPEDDEDERPSRRSRSRDEDEDEDRPRSSRRRLNRDEDEEDPPKRRSSRREEPEDEEEERPRSRRRSRDEDEEEDKPRGRRRARDDEEDEEERKPRTSSVREGWDGYKTNKAKGGDFPEELKITGDPELIKFLQEEPITSFRQHWIDNPPGDIRKKSWTCIEDDCPLCDLGDRPRVFTVFNVLHLSTGGDPENKILQLGTKATGQLLNFAEDRKTGPLPKHYYAVSKSGKGTSTAYNFRPVKDRDLEEDWEIDPLTDDELDEAMEGLYDKSIIQVPSRKQLRELAQGLTDDD